MSVLAPAAAALLLLLPILVMFYLLKVRRRDYEVGSTYLWRQLTRDVTAHEPWQRLRWNPLLLLQALVMLAIIAALTRPYLAKAATTTAFEVLVVDGSASMQATDVKPSRFAQARLAATKIVDRLPASAAVAVIEAGGMPHTLVSGTTDRAAVQSALATMHPFVSVTNMRDALEVALALARSHQQSRIDVITDGAFTNVSDIGAGNVPIHTVTVGGQGQNEGITALSARPQPTSPDKLAVFVRVLNDTTQPAANEVTLLADGQPLASRPFTAGPGAAQSFVFDNVPASARVIGARLRGGDDLAADDQAYLVRQQRPPPRVLLVTDGNRFLLTALRLLPIQLFQTTPGQLGAINADSYDLVVLDHAAPAILPKGNLLLVDPPNSPLVPIAGTVGPLAATSTQRDDSLLKNVDLSGLQVRRASKVTVPSWARILADANGVPLLLSGETQTRRIVVLPFAIQESNLWGLPGFPILMANAITVLGPQDTSGLAAAGQSDLLLFQPLAGVDRIDVTRPDHTTVRLAVSPGRSVAYDDTEQAGLYTVTQRAGARVVTQETEAVNLLSADETDIRAGTAPVFAQPEKGTAGSIAGSAVAPFELWPYVTVLATLLLLGEWWWYQRRA